MRACPGFVFAICWSLSVGVVGTSAFADAPLPGEIRGALVLVGGGDIPEAIRREFFRLAGGAKAKIVWIPTASVDADDAPRLQKQLASWQALRPEALTVLHTRDRQRANTPEFVAALKQATAVWLTGGDQAKLLDTYAGTAVSTELRALLQRGGVIGGTSAGAMVIGTRTIERGQFTPSVRKGFDLWPGVVVDSHFLQRNRVDRLLKALAQSPGCWGVGLDEGTAIVVQGRTFRVWGSGYATVILSASKHRPASVQMLPAEAMADLVQLGRAVRAREGPEFPSAHPRPPEVPRGSLLLAGGGMLPTEVMQRFIDLAGGVDAPIVYVATAHPDPIPANPMELRMLRRLGAKNITVLHTRDRKQADSEQFVAPLRSAKGVWFSGGRQWRFVDAYEGTLTEQCFHEVLKRGGVIGGSSAGASIQAEYLVRGHPLGNTRIIAEGYERGFGFLPGVAVDQHFFAYRRQADMSELMQTFPQLLGIGLEEGTAIVVRGGVLEVLGRGPVAIYDRQRPIPEGQADYEVLTRGAKYDLRQRQRLTEP